MFGPRYASLTCAARRARLVAFQFPLALRFGLAKFLYHLDTLGQLAEAFVAAQGIEIVVGEQKIVDAARRWAVSLGDGSLVFVDSGDLAPA